ncbi:hypothetical protein HDV06_000131 [Boothiomyces sp. JEL0866]|nr:hypothetical protein HDV06_000131 [Boothiomyces sp. JEL0866]
MIKKICSLKLLCRQYSDKLPDILKKSDLQYRVLGKGTSFDDFQRVIFKGGKGGDGFIAFFKTPSGEPNGPPSGGNGGNGGNVRIIASKHYTSLSHISATYKVPDGKNGRSKHMHGENGETIEIKVPVGTVIRQVEPWKVVPPKREIDIHEDPRLNLLEQHYIFRNNYLPQEDRIRFLKESIPRKRRKQPLFEFDLKNDGDSCIVFEGGRGGLGNPHYQTANILSPGFAGRGEMMGDRYYEFELKTLADAGLVGLPNAGKSTLLKAVSNAHPQIAPYPFTTLNPYVGTIDFDDYWTMTLADMPGIIKGAHQNHGLGLRFLRHVERNKIFVYVIDLAGEEPWQDLETLQSELELYKKGLTNRPSIVAANKADISESAKKNLEMLKSKTSLPIVPISAKYSKNILQLTGLMRHLVESVKE